MGELYPHSPANGAELMITTFPNGDTAAGAIYADGVQTATFLRPDGRTYTTIFVPHGYHGPRLREVIREHAPNAPLHTARKLSRDPDAPAWMVVRWASMLVFDTTDAARAA